MLYFDSKGVVSFSLLMYIYTKHSLLLPLVPRRKKASGYRVVSVSCRSPRTMNEKPEKLLNPDRQLGRVESMI